MRAIKTRIPVANGAEVEEVLSDPDKQKGKDRSDIVYCMGLGLGPVCPASATTVLPEG